MAFIEPLAHILDGSLLIVSVRDLVIDREIGNVGARCATRHYQFEVFGGMESIETASRISETVDAMNLVAVGVVNHRTHMITLFEAVGVKFCLVFADNRIFACAFGFNHGKRLAVGAKQHIVGITFTGIVRHTADLDLDTGFAAYDVALRFQYFPTCFAEHKVDEAAASFGFRNIAP